MKRSTRWRHELFDEFVAAADMVPDGMMPTAGQIERLERPLANSPIWNMRAAGRPARLPVQFANFSTASTSSS